MENMLFSLATREFPVGLLRFFSAHLKQDCVSLDLLTESPFDFKKGLPHSQEASYSDDL
jgi:hypothetical protein